MNDLAKDSARAQILVVEDSSVFREMQGLLLRQAGHGAWLYESPQAALAEAAKQKFDLVVIDYELPEMNGEQFMHALRAIQPGIAVVFVSGSLTLDLAIKLSSQGVAGIFNKPANPKTLLEKINETLSRAARDTAVRAGSNSPHSTARTSATPAVATPAAPPPPGQLAYEPRYVFGTGDTFREFTHRLWKVRDFRAALLLQGEVGSSFELFARELAGISLFREGPVMLCDADEFEPRRLIEVLAPSLLSHDAGTLIVNGVETFTTEQQKTLENLTTGRDVFLPFARRFRLVLAATPRLAERVDDGDFNENLYYKISSLSLTVPSLRDMNGDIAANARHLLEHRRRTVDAKSPTAFTADAAAWIEAQNWPGNYAQLVRTLHLAVRYVTSAELDVSALEAGLLEYEGEQPSAPTAVAPATPEPAKVHGYGSAVATPVAPAPVPAGVAAVAAVPVAAVRTEPVPTATPQARPAADPSDRNRALTTRCLFRPASNAYNFGKRLAESLATADACNAS